MRSPAVVGSQTGEVALVSTVPDLSDALSKELYTLIAQQPFFKGLNNEQLQLLAASALEMKFETGTILCEEGSPANRFYLILTGQVVLSSEMEDRNVIPIQTLGLGDDLGWSWLFPLYSMHFTARALEPTTTIFFMGHGCANSANRTTNWATKSRSESPKWRPSRSGRRSDA